MKSNKEDRFCPENYPISATAQNGKCSIAPWNRNYMIDGSPFLSSVLSQGVELLSAPMRLVGIENGKELVITDVISDMIHGCKDGSSVTACQYMRSSRFRYASFILPHF